MIQTLRTAHGPMTAQALAERLEVSKQGLPRYREAAVPPHTRRGRSGRGLHYATGLRFAAVEF
ncbi:MAG: HTH domain-containing protein [Roseobacter sp.]